MHNRSAGILVKSGVFLSFLLSSCSPSIKTLEGAQALLESAKEISPFKSAGKSLLHLSVAEQSYGVSNSRNLYAQMSGYKGWGSYATELYLFDGKSWSLAGKCTTDHMDTTIAFSPDDSVLVVAGGYTDWNDAQKRVDIFHVKEGFFERIADLNRNRMENITVTSREGDFVTVGGVPRSGSTPYDTFEVYNAEDDEWIEYPLHYSRGMEFSAVATSKGIVVIGGRDTTVYDEDTGEPIGGAVELITKNDDGTYTSNLLPNLNVDRDSPKVEVVTLNARNANSTFGEIGDVIVFVFSGYGQSILEDNSGLTYEYLNLSKAEDTWHVGSELLPYDRWDSYGFTLQNQIHLFGGWVATEGTFKDIIFDIKTGTFTAIDTLDVDGGQGGAGKVITAEGDEVGVYSAGWRNSDSVNSGIAPTIYISNLTNGQWSNSPSDQILGHSYDGASLALSKTEILTCGGFMSGELVATNECKIYNFTTGEARATGRMNHARGEFTIARNPKDGVIFAIGGTNKYEPVYTVEAYDPNSGTWSDKTDIGLGMRRPIVNFHRNGDIYFEGADFRGLSLNTHTLSKDLMTFDGITSSGEGEILEILEELPRMVLELEEARIDFAQFYLPLPKETGSILYLPFSSTNGILENLDRRGGMLSMLVDTNSNSELWYDSTAIPVSRYEGVSAALTSDGSVIFMGASAYKNSNSCSTREGLFSTEIAGGECSFSYVVNSPANFIYHTYANEQHEADTWSPISDPERSSHFPTIITLKNGKIAMIGGGDYLDYYSGGSSLLIKVAYMVLEGSVSDTTWTHAATELLQVYDPETDTWESKDGAGTAFLYPAVGVSEDFTLLYGSYHGIDYVSGNEGLTIEGAKPIDQRVRYNNQQGIQLGK